MHLVRKITIGFLIGIAFLAGRGHAASAASLNFSPATATENVGKSFTVSVVVSSSDQAMNAVSASISFPADKLEVVSLSKAGSVMNLWVQEPSFSNSAGTIQADGVVLNPGYKGGAGKILAIQFRATSSGSAALSFASAAVLANDGQGTNILSGLGTARIAIDVPVTGPAAPRATTPVPPPGRPFAPQVRSSTHADSNAWYANANPVLKWDVPAGATGVSVALDHSPVTDPGTRSDGIIEDEEYKKVEDGKWYFHVRVRNSEGWGAITHFQIQIDTKPPEAFVIESLEGKETSNPTPSIVFATMDATSGVVSYKVKIGEAEAVAVSPSKVANRTPYILPALDPGRRTIVAQAFDRAGNVTTSTEEIVIIPLDPPRVTSYPKELAVGEILKVQGSTYPDATVIIRLTPEHDTPIMQETKSSGSGAFELIWPDRPRSGLYTIAAQVVDGRGAKSNFSAPITIEARERAVLRIGSLVIDYLSVTMSLLGILVLLVALVVFVWYRLIAFRKRLRKEVREAEEAVHSTFDAIRDELNKQIKILEKAEGKRELTSEEEKLLRRLRAMMNSGEALIDKEMADVEQATETVLKSRRRAKSKRPSVPTSSRDTL